LDTLINTLGITPADRFLGAAPFSHVNGLVRTMLASFRAGAAVYTIPQFDRQRVIEVIEQHRLTVWISVPFMFNALAESRLAQPPDFSSLRLCVSASAPLRKIQPPILSKVWAICTSVVRFDRDGHDERKS
jgi:long-chain acyl-CoA synthetase